MFIDEVAPVPEAVGFGQGTLTHTLELGSGYNYIGLVVGSKDSGATVSWDNVRTAVALPGTVMIVR